MKNSPSQVPAQRFEDQIEKKDWLPAKKDLYLSFFRTLDAQKQQEYEKKRFPVWKKNGTFDQMLQNQLTDSMNRFRISSMVIVMMGTVVLHFIFTFFTGVYLINFSIDALVASACLAFLVVNLRTKYKLLKDFGSIRDYQMMDILSVVLCILVEIMVAFTGLDLSIIILIGSYYLQKRKFSHFLHHQYLQSI